MTWLSFEEFSFTILLKTFSLLLSHFFQEATGMILLIVFTFFFIREELMTKHKCIIMRSRYTLLLFL